MASVFLVQDVVGPVLLVEMLSAVSSLVLVDMFFPGLFCSIFAEVAAPYVMVGSSEVRRRLFW